MVNERGEGARGKDGGTGANPGLLRGLGLGLVSIDNLGSLRVTRLLSLATSIPELFLSHFPLMPMYNACE